MSRETLHSENYASLLYNYTLLEETILYPYILEKENCNQKYNTILFYGNPTEVSRESIDEFDENREGGREERKRNVKETDLHRRTYCWSQHPNTEPGIRTRCWIAAVVARSGRGARGAPQPRPRHPRRQQLPVPRPPYRIPAPCRSPARAQD